MDKIVRSPRITSLSWGHIEIDGTKTYKDVKLFPGGSEEWDWNETGTGHHPGIQPIDVEKLIDHGAKAVILSKGVYGRLKVLPETMQMLKDRDITVIVHNTKKAASLYNGLIDKEPVGGLFHTTC